MAWQPAASLQTLREKARIYAQIRAFFAAANCLEVDTPLLSASTNTDVNIESIASHHAGDESFLQTSPEFAMKRLLAAGCGSIYQICHAFRRGEKGRRHNPEFTLLEWYRVGYDYQQLMDDVEQLINTLSLQTHQFQRVRYRDVMLEKTGIDIDRINLDELRIESAVLVSGCDTGTLNFDQCLDLLISMVVAPQLEGFVFIYDYPLSQAALARVSARNPRVAERFELFFGDLELANGFSELTDATLQRQRFEQDNQQRVEQGLRTYPVDDLLLDAISAGLPECAGVALGLERLLMVLLNYESIDQVLSFSD